MASEGQVVEVLLTSLMNGPAVVPAVSLLEGLAAIKFKQSDRPLQIRRLRIDTSVADLPVAAVVRRLAVAGQV